MEYSALVSAFKPILFDADEWVQLAADSGMNYMVMTSKHADGFAMFHSKVDEYNIVDATPFGRDVVGELSEACRKYGLKFGLYYSQDIDHHHPHGGGYTQGHTAFSWGKNTSWTNDWDFPDNNNKDYSICYEEKIRPQVEEILRNYGELSLIWFDNPLTISEEQSAELFAMVKKYQPDALINSRIGNDACDYRTLGDNEISDEFFGEELVETPATLNDTLGYKAFDQNWKSADEIRCLKRHLNERGINYLLNVGPDYLGRIPAPIADILRAVGAEPYIINQEGVEQSPAGDVLKAAPEESESPGSTIGWRSGSSVTLERNDMCIEDEIAYVNRRNWDWAVRKGAGCTVPWLDLDADLVRRCASNEINRVPERLENIMRTLSGYLPSIGGKDVLCLASGGGQQSAVFGLLGAHVTVFDLCDGQLGGDRKAATHYGYPMKTIQGDMRDLSCLSQESFDLVYGTGMPFVPDVHPVYSGVSRALRPGGLYRVDFTNPAMEFSDAPPSTEGSYDLPIPYSVKRFQYAVDDGGEPSIQFRHYFDEIFNGLPDHGFLLRRVFDDPSGWTIAIVAQKRGAFQQSGGSDAEDRTLHP